MCEGLVTLAEDLIAMRKNPLRNKAAMRYPAAAMQFAADVAGCDDPDVLRKIIVVDTGHVLPPPVKQGIFTRLLAHERTPDLLRAYGMHLVMFGYTDENGALVYDTDAMTNALYDEADVLDNA